MLIFNAAQKAIVDGRRSLNLSSGPNIAKMRWSSTVATHHDFDIVPRRRRSQLLNHAYAHAALARQAAKDWRGPRALRASAPAAAAPNGQE